LSFVEKVTSIVEYRRRKARAPNRKAEKSPRARCTGDPTFDVGDVLRQLESVRAEMNYYLLDILEDAAVERLDQVRRYGLGLSRRISVATARRVDHEGLRDLVREASGRPRQDLVRGVHLRILHVPVTADGQSRPTLETYFVITRTDETVTVLGASVRRDGELHDTRRVVRIPAALAFWRREPLDRFLRDFLRDQFEELEGAPHA
jgi:hypothetical protein